MRLNHTVGEITGSWTEYGEWVYFISLFGAAVGARAVGLADRRPSPDRQLLRPRRSDRRSRRCSWAPSRWSPRRASTRARACCSPSRTRGSSSSTRCAPTSAARRFSTTPSSRRCCRRSAASALTGESRPPRFATTCSSRTRASGRTELTAGQREQLLRLAALYTGKLRQGHAELWLDTVRQHLDDTHFVWMGGTGQDGRLLLPHPQPGHPDRVRPSAGHRVRQRRADAAAHPHRGADAERQRLRHGLSAPAPRAVRARQWPACRENLSVRRHEHDRGRRGSDKRPA